MGIWLATPIGTEDANTLHTIIQNAKIDIMERMRVTNADAVDEHIVFGGSATGRHKASKVGFAVVYANSSAFIAANSFAKDGTLHFIADINSIYVGRAATPGSSDPFAYIELIATTDHGAFSNLNADDHTQYILKDGSRVMTDNLTIDAAGVLTVNTFEIAVDQPIASAHLSLSWFAAHGADSIVDATFQNDSFMGLYITNFPYRIAPTNYDFCIRFDRNSSGVLKLYMYYLSGTTVYNTNVRKYLKNNYINATSRVT